MIGPGLRQIYVEGPRAKDGPIYRLVCDVVYDDDNTLQNAVDRMPALRAMGLNPPPANVVEIGNIGGAGPDLERLDFLAPSLMRARVDPASGRLPTIAAPVHQEGSDSEVHYAEDRVKDLVLVPNQTWPVETDANQILVPSFRLAAGSVAVRLRTEDDHDAAFARFLNYDRANNTVFGGWRLFEATSVTSDEGLLAHLVPEGVELDVLMPNPVKAMIGTGASDLPARLRLEPDGADGYRAQVVGGPTAEAADALAKHLSELSGVFGGLRRQQSPLDIRIDQDLELPPYLWLFSVVGGRLFASESHEWRLRLAPENLIMRLHSGNSPNSGRPAVARLNLDGGGPVFTRVADTVGMELARGSGTAGTVKATYGRRQPGTAGLPPVAESAEVGTIGLETLQVDVPDVYLPMAEAVAREREQNPATVPTAVGQASPEQHAQDLFLMLDNGTLQVSPLSGRLKEPVINQEQAAFDGGIVFGFENATLELDRATALTVRATWANLSVVDITISVGGVSGGLRNAVWMALEAPTPERLLPTGHADPAMSREIVAVIGGSRLANFHLTIQSRSDVNIDWKLQAFGADQRPARDLVYWVASDRLPLVSAMPMLALGDEGAGPSDLRNLVPRGVDADSDWCLRSSPGDGLPLLEDDTPIALRDFDWPWPDLMSDAGLSWGRLAIPMVNPLAPGVEYSFDQISREVTHASLRYDLPILDEFFAGLSADDPPEPEDGQSGPEQQNRQARTFDRRVQGVLSPVVMQAHWHEQAIRLGLSRTQMARATAWSDIDTEGTQGPGNLVRGIDSTAQVQFPDAYSLTDYARDLSLGAYSIAWPLQLPTRYSGEDALIGLRGEYVINGSVIEPLTTSNQDETHLRIEGFATALYEESEDVLHDANRTGFKRGPESESATVFERIAKVTGPQDGAEEQTVTLHSLVEPIALDGDLMFWARDLPLKGGVFEGKDSPLEAYLGPTTNPFKPGQSALSLYEWRFGRAPQSNMRPGYWFQRGLLRYWPLRLLHYQPNVRLKLLCRIEMAGPLPDDVKGQARFQSDRPYETGDLVEWDYDLSAEPRARVMELVAGAETLEFTGVEPRLSFLLSVTMATHLAGATHLSDEPEARRAIRLSGRLGTDGKLVDVRLEFSMLGRNLVVDLEEETSTLEDKDVLFRLKTRDAHLPHFGFSLENLRLNATTSRLDAWLVGGIPIDGPQENRPMALLCKHEAGAYKSYWLGLGGLTFAQLDADHDRGTLQLATREGPLLTGAPISGLPVDRGLLEMAAVLVLTAPDPEHDDPTHWRVDTGHVTAKLTADLKTGDSGSQVTLYSSTDVGHGDDGKAGVKVTSNIRLDWVADAPRTSGVQWDPEAIKVIEEDPAQLGNPSSTMLEIEGSPATKRYEHRVRTSLQGHALETDLLQLASARVAGSAEVVQLADQIPVTLFVEHELIKDAGGKRILSWAALEPAVLTQARLWAIGYDPDSDGDDARVFGPRYKFTANKYRGEPQSGISHPGIGTRREMLGGFDDRSIWDGAVVTADRDPIVLIGGGPGLVQFDASTMVFGLPWVIPFQTQSLPPIFSNLMAFDGIRRKWRAARFDATVTSPGPSLPDAPLPVPHDARGASDIRKFLIKGLPVENGFAYRAMARLVEQTFVEPAEAGADVPDRTVPIFLYALVALRALLQKIGGGEQAVLSVATLHPIRRFDDGGLEDAFAQLTIAKADPAPHVPAASKSIIPTGHIELVALRRGGLVERRQLQQAPAIDPQNAELHISDIGAVADGYGPVLLRKMAENLLERPDAALLVQSDSEGRAEALWGIPFLPEPRPFGADAGALTDPGHEVYPSPAMGWPEFPWIGGGGKPGRSAALLGLRTGGDDPVLSPAAGLSARSAGFALAAPAAAPENSVDARYVATQARALFEHGSSSDQITFPSPPSRNMQIMSPRARTPLWEPREKAMREAGSQGDGGSDALAETVNILPLGYSRSLIGERPGAFETMVDCVLQDGSGRRSDEDGDSLSKTALHESSVAFGRAASVAPLVMRQLRIPRSPALPVGQLDGSVDEAFDPAVRRRTYVSFGDLSGAAESDPRPDPIANHLARPFPASFWRGKLEDTPFRIVVELLSETLQAPQIEAAMASGRGYDVQLNARVLSDGRVPMSERQAIEALQSSGVLPSTGAEIGSKKVSTFDAWIAIGVRRFDAVAIALGHDRLAPFVQTDAGNGAATEPAPISEIDGADRVIQLRVEFPPDRAADFLEELVAPDANERASLHLAMRDIGGSPDTLDTSAVSRFEIRRMEVLEPAGVEGIETFKLTGGLPRSISLQLSRAPAQRLSRAVTSTTYLFADPAFDRILTTPAGHSNIVKQVTTNEEFDWLLALDRMQYDADGTLFLTFGRLDAAEGGMLSPNTMAAENANLSFRATFPGATKAVDLRLSPGEMPASYLINEAQTYAIPISMLTSAMDTESQVEIPAGSRPPPGSKIEIQVSDFLTVGGVQSGTLIYVFELAKKIKNPAPAAVYSTLRLDGTFEGDKVPTNPQILLHRTAPMPSRTDFPDLLDDLARGSVRRSAIFEWTHRSARHVASETQSFLIKTDRSGGAQLPVHASDFQTIKRKRAGRAP